MSSKIRPIAIYLPQFHPVAENNEWWGKGFTEWTNVVKGKPRFKDHYQPHLPSDLGFYDLRLPETREEQAQLARSYGIHGFCYYHYWFNGKRILERPFTEVFESGSPDFPFMLCWANENWTRIWDGGENKVLLKQEYSHEDDRNHIRSLIPYFKDSRYIKVDGKPVFAIYKDSLFPDITRTIEIFREECRKENIQLYLCRFDRGLGTLRKAPEELGFDAAIDFQPLSRSYNEFVSRKSYVEKKYDRVKGLFRKAKSVLTGEPNISDTVIDYGSFIDYDLSKKAPAYKQFPCVSPGWDNSSRRATQKAIIFKNSTPQLFKKWVLSKCRNFSPYSHDENFLFINAWNEWAEGNHLEPCHKFGHQYLEALRDGVAEASTTGTVHAQKVN